MLPSNNGVSRVSQEERDNGNSESRHIRLMEPDGTPRFQATTYVCARRSDLVRDRVDKWGILPLFPAIF
jgi:hypothetical protein